MTCEYCNANTETPFPGAQGMCCSRRCAALALKAFYALTLTFVVSCAPADIQVYEDDCWRGGAILEEFEPMTVTSMYGCSEETCASSWLALEYNDDEYTAHCLGDAEFFRIEYID